MVPAEVEIDPRRGPEEVPVARGYGLAVQVPLFAVILQPGVGLHIDALSLFRIDLAETVETSAAGPVSLVFRALARGTVVRHIDQGAIPAVLAIEEGHLRQVLQLVEGALQRRSIDRPADRGHEAVEVLPGLEHQLMDDPRQAVGEIDRGIQRPSLPPRRRFGVQPRGRVPIEIVESVRLRIVEMVDQVPPVGAQGLTLADDLFDLFILDVVPADMDAAEPHPLHDGVHPRRPQQPRPHPLVRGAALLVELGEELVRDDAAGDLVLVHHLSRPEGEDVDVPHHRDVQVDSAS